MADPPTHIVADTKNEHAFLRKLGVRRFADVPEEIPIVKWDWILSGRIVGSRGDGAAASAAVDVSVRFDPEFVHAAFAKKMPAVVSRRSSGAVSAAAAVKDKGKGRAVELVSMDQNKAPPSSGPRSRSRSR